MANLERLDKTAETADIPSFLERAPLIRIAKTLSGYFGGEIDIDSIRELLMEISERGSKFHFNLNRDIQRLLLCKYPEKLVLSGEKDVLGFNNIQSKDYVDGVKIKKGTMERGRIYEENRLEEIFGKLKNILGNRFVLGMYGQLSFHDNTSSESVKNLFSEFFDRFNSPSLAVCHSGSLIGVGAIAYAESLKRGVPTIGIIPKSMEHIVSPDKFTHLVVEGEDWGESAFVFGGLPDQVVFAGGGYWSYLEALKAQEQNKPITFLEFPGSRYCPKMINAKKQSLRTNA